MIKFPTDYGVRELRGDQVAARECYISMLDDHLQTMNMEEQWAMVEPVEGLEEIPLNNSRLKRKTRISTLASRSVCQALASFLRENRDVFA